MTPRDTLTLWWVACRECDYESEPCSVERHAERDAEDHNEAADHEFDQQVSSLIGIE